MPKRIIRFRIIRNRPAIASPPTEAPKKPIPPIAPHGMSLLSAEALPLPPQILDRDLSVTYNTGTIYGTLHKANKHSEDVILEESNEKTYCVVLKQGDQEIILKAEMMAQFSEKAMKFFNDAYVKMQVDRMSYSPVAEVGFSNDEVSDS